VKVWHIVGIDPGLVHTGVVRLDIGDGELINSHTVVKGIDAAAVAAWIGNREDHPDKIFIEKYDPRMHFSSDERMVKGEAALRSSLKRYTQVEFIKNRDIKQAVPLVTLNMMGLWNFPTVTHHQDLRSAARIAVMGMMRTPSLNLVLADMMRDALDGNPWPVTDLGGGVSLASVAD